MARIFPDGWRELAPSGAAARQLQTLAQLAAGLDDGYSVFHGVHWTRVEQHDHAIFGEIDFAIVGPTGKLLLIEQKSGFLAETTDGLVTRHRGHDTSVACRLAGDADALHSRLRRFVKGQQTCVDALLYCPDYTVKQAGTAGIDPARIVDASRREQLLPVIRAILPAAGDADSALPAREAIHRFLGDILQLVPEVNAVVGQTQTLYTRLAGGLAHWARRIDAEPFRLRVVGTAGSGKTQLAMAVFRDAVAAGRRPLYVCYNRPLADHIALLAPAGGLVTSYHQFGDRLCRIRGEPPDFTRPNAFARIEAMLDEYLPTDDACFDELIVDEGQDFHARWANNLLRWLRPAGRAWWLEDPLQNLYGRPPVPLPGWVSLRSEINFRSPGDILDSLNRMLPLPQRLESGSPLRGSQLDIVSYGDGELAARTVAAVTRCIGLGFRRSHIAIISYHGRESSRLTPCDRLGPYPLRAPTGHYDLLGNPLRTDGEVLIDSVHRFKGQSAPCVVFTEIDFATLDEAAMRRLFVGATRATMKLVMVVADSSAKVLRERLEAA